MLIPVLVVALAAASDIAPPPKGEWVVDQTGAVRPETLHALNEIANALDADGLGQLGVLVVDSIEGAVPRTFALNVFNHWGLSQRDPPDGTFLLIALGDRKAEIVLGRGSELSPWQTDEVMARDLVANMKQGLIDEALLSTASALAALHREFGGDTTLLPYARRVTPFPLVGGVVDLAGALTDEEEAALPCALPECVVLVVRATKTEPQLKTLADALRKQTGAVTVVALDVGLGAAVVQPDSESVESLAVKRVKSELADARATPATALKDALAFTARVRRDGYPPLSFDDVAYDVSKHVGVAVCVGVVFLLVGFFIAIPSIGRMNRRRIRTCKRCATPRRLLSETEEDAHLTTAQQAEEKAKSVEYDVWWCGTCCDATVLSWAGLSLGVKHCPQCKAKTKLTTESETVAPEQYTAGRKRLEERCLHCTYVREWDVIIPSHFDSSSSSSDSSSSSSDSSGSGSSGSW